MKPTVKFNWDDLDRAGREWGANCGPGAIAAILGKTLDEIHPYLGDFKWKHYTNPRLMFEILRNLGATYKLSSAYTWPMNGLVRVQWEGPWTEPSVPWSHRQRHTHWVASSWSDDDIWIFDINCICVGGWVIRKEWETQVVPWLIKQVEPEANGKWHTTHRLEVLI